jgi:hypothetical protein
LPTDKAEFSTSKVGINQILGGQKLITPQRTTVALPSSELESVLALRTSESEIDGYLLSGSLSGN